jgi:TolB-like protein
MPLDSLSNRPALWETGPVPPSADEVRIELDRILASAVFVNAARLRRFLKFVVDEALAGRAERLKEYVIGVEVFDRDPQYDPRLDSIVRVEAGRVRTKLEEYYNNGGGADAVTIRLPKGSYAPAFERRSACAPAAEPDPPVSLPRAAAAPAAQRPASQRRGTRRLLGAALGLVALVAVAAIWRAGESPRTAEARTTIAVLPLTPYSTAETDGIAAARLTEAVTAELVRAGGFAVVSSSAARAFAANPLGRDAADALGADVLLEGRLLAQDGRLRVEARLVNASRNEKFWVESVLGDPADPDELARRVAAAAVEALRPANAAGER